MKLTLWKEDDLKALQDWFGQKGLVDVLLVEAPNFGLPNLCYIIRLDDDTPVGFVTLYNIDFQHKVADAGIALPDKRGRGLSHGAGRMLLELAFGEIGLRRVRLKILESNRMARRLAELFGFVSEGVERQAVLKEQGPEDVYIYGLLKDEFKEG